MCRHYYCTAMNEKSVSYWWMIAYGHMIYDRYSDSLSYLCNLKLGFCLRQPYFHISRDIEIAWIFTVTNSVDKFHIMKKYFRMKYWLQYFDLYSCTYSSILLHTYLWKTSCEKMDVTPALMAIIFWEPKYIK